MNRSIYILALFIGFLGNSQYGIDPDLKAFPLAFGGGAETTGGRGKVLCIVNTLNWKLIL